PTLPHRGRGEFGSLPSFLSDTRPAIVGARSARYRNSSARADPGCRPIRLALPDIRTRSAYPAAQRPAPSLALAIARAIGSWRGSSRASRSLTEDLARLDKSRGTWSGLACGRTAKPIDDRK